jgi:hypothetical protein
MSDKEIDRLEAEACRDDDDGEVDYATSVALAKSVDAMKEYTDEELRAHLEKLETEQSKKKDQTEKKKG